MSSDHMGESRGCKPPFDCEGLAAELDQDEVIRSHLRADGATLFDDGHPDTVKSACQDPVFQTLTILCLRTASVEGHPQPPVGPLRDELENLYKKCGKQATEATIVNDSWCIRKFLTFVKMKTRKGMVSTASWHNSFFNIYRWFPGFGNNLQT